MEERIISYELTNQIPQIIQTHLAEKFLFVRHNSNKKLLFFKKHSFQPISLLED
jgi:hypothetical protein